MINPVTHRNSHGLLAGLLAAYFGVMGYVNAQTIEETLAFEAASRSLQLGVFDRAEKEFAEFAQNFSSSPRVPEALLYQARAALRQEKFQAAIDLLSSNAAKATGITDRYRYWLGEAYLRSGNYLAAADTFASLTRDFPESPRLLSAAYGQAMAHFRLKEWHRVVDLLQNPEGKFQRASYERPTDELSIRGRLLLVEALIELNDPATAERALTRLSGRNLNSELQWHRDYLGCRLEIARGKLDSALSLSTNLMALAATSDRLSLKAESVALQGSILERGGEFDAAVQVYSNNLAAGVPADRRRTAFFRIIELTLAQNKLAEATQRMEEFFAQHPDEAGSDIALLTLGELHLKQHVLASQMVSARANAGGVVSTNHLSDALSRFDRLLMNFPQSPLVGHAHLNRGWCFWEQGKIAESQLAFKRATDHLHSSEHLAVARFKVADTQFLQRDYTNALATYRRLARDLPTQPRNPLLAQVYYQILRASLEVGDTQAATDAMRQLLERFADGLYSHRGLLLVGEGLVREAKPAEAREVFMEFATRFPDSALLPQVEAAVARSHIEEKNWAAAIDKYEAWLQRFSTNTLRPQVEFDRAWANYLAGKETNALVLFTNLITTFPQDQLSAKAQYWVADFYFRHENYTNAEIAFQSATLVNSALAYQARMMAGRAAFARQAYKNAYDYFISVVNDQNCPADLAAEAFFALGDTILMRDGDVANPIRKFDEAKEAFRRIPQLYPESRLVPLALGQIANCYFQMASSDPRYHTNALESYSQVLAPTNRADIAARSQAELGIGQVIERQAALISSGNGELLKTAQQHYLNVFNGKNLRAGERPDPFWLREAGLAAARLAEEQKQWETALNIYTQLIAIAPPLRNSLERKIARVRDQLQPAKS